MDINKLTLDEKIGQMLAFAFHGTEYNEQLRILIEEFKIGNIIHFARNIINVEQVKKLNSDIQNHATIPMFISLDHEGGMVRRVMDNITYLPGAMALCATKENIEEITYLANLDLKKCGFNVNHAPVADVNNNPKNPVINSRSYSDDPVIVGRLIKESIRGMDRANMLPTLKHFPGHGDTNVDSHLGLPVVEKTIKGLNTMELAPFKDAIAAGVDGIMVAHILYTQLDDTYPSSLSYNIITKLLKEELGYKGIITTDSLTMAAIWNKYSIPEIVLHSINAGNDIILFCGKADIEEQREIVQAFKDLVNQGKISMERINESVNKILSAKAKYTKINNEPIVKNHLAEELVYKSMTKVIDENKLLPLKEEDRVLILFPKLRIASLVDNANQDFVTLGNVLSGDEIIYEDNVDIRKNVVQIQQKYDKIIMATYNVVEDDFQVKLANLLDKSKTLFVSLRSPFDFDFIKGIKTYICTYDSTPESLKALSMALKGKFNGVLPIKLWRN